MDNFILFYLTGSGETIGVRILASALLDTKRHDLTGFLLMSAVISYKACTDETAASKPSSLWRECIKDVFARQEMVSRSWIYG